MLLRNFASMARNRSWNYNDGTRDDSDSSTFANFYRGDGNGDAWWTSSSPYGTSRVVIGCGTTPVTFTDYKLADDSIMSSVTCTSSMNNIYQLDNKIASVSTTYQNISSSPITVTEVGFVAKPNGHGTPRHSHHLLTRTILETPIIMQPGEQYTFTITILVN